LPALLADSVFATPAPYAAFGLLIGLTTAAASRHAGRSWLVVVAAGMAGGCVVVGAAEWEASRPFTTSDPLTNTDRAVPLISTLVGAVLGAAPVAYARWVRRVFRETEDRLRR
jgi:hypothetical protein